VLEHRESDSGRLYYFARPKSETLIFASREGVAGNRGARQPLWEEGAVLLRGGKGEKGSSRAGLSLPPKT